MASCKVGAQVPPHLFIDDRDMTIMRVVYMEHGLSLPALPGLDLGIGEGEMQEMHAGCLAFRRAPFNVALRRGGDLFSIDAEKDVIFHPAERSEEHTSELQSLMRISYAVFCLKKTKQYKHQQYTMYNTTIKYSHTTHTYIQLIVSRNK